MYKFLRIYYVKRNGNEVVSAKYKVISEFEKFHYDIRTSEKLISICREKNLPDINSGNMYSVVKYENNIPVADEAQLFYHTDSKNESFLDIAEWDARVVTSVALGRNLIIGI